MGLRVLVCGGRDYKDANCVVRTLGAIDVDCLIEGGANGADHIAGLWAEQHGVQHIIERADWNKHGRAAGPIRNAKMLHDHKPDLVVAFPGGKGTAHMVSIAMKNNIEVRSIAP